MKGLPNEVSVDCSSFIDGPSCLALSRTCHWWCNLYKDKVSFSEEILNQAASLGHLKLLQWMRDNNTEWSEDTCLAAVTGGQKHVVRWLHENCPYWDGRTLVREAAKGNSFEVFRELVDLCPGNQFGIFGFACQGTNLEIVKLASQLDNSVYDQKYSLTGASVRAGNLEILKWHGMAKVKLLARGPCFPFFLAARLDVLKWLHEEGGFDPPSGIFSQPEVCRNFGIWKWFSENNFELPAKGPYWLCRDGTPEMLEWLIPKVPKFDPTKGFRFAVRGANIPVLEWLVDKIQFQIPNSLFLTSDCEINPIGENIYQIFQWLRDRGCLLEGPGVISGALEASLDMVKELMALGTSVPQCHAYVAVQAKKFEIVKYLVEEVRLEINSQDVSAALSSGDFRILNYFLEKKFMKFLSNIPYDLSPKTLRWLLRNNLLTDPELARHVKNNNYPEISRWFIGIEELD